MKGEIIPLIGVYDVFSATIAGNYFNGIFISGFSFAASYYGLPDIGFISWSDITSFVQRVRTILPDHHLVVDIDDGYADVELAGHVVSLLESIGASCVILEDQKRPKRCGHFDGKRILELDEYLEKLDKVLKTRKDLFVIARTDASDAGEIGRRVEAFADAGADALLVDGLKDLDVIRELNRRVDRPFVFNQIAGGKSSPKSLKELKDAGVSLAIYSTPCLFAAQVAVEDAMISLRDSGGLLPVVGDGGGDVHGCNAILDENLARRDSRREPVVRCTDAK
jgi:2-methylisocitrate lyase-like PEP mutase family enzyme